MAQWNLRDDWYGEDLRFESDLTSKTVRELCKDDQIVLFFTRKSENDNDALHCLKVLPLFLVALQHKSDAFDVFLCNLLFSKTL